jgi:hypothetical protein
MRCAARASPALLASAGTEECGTCASQLVSVREHSSRQTAKGAGGGAGLLTLSGGVGREFDDEVSVEGCADSFQQRDRGHDAAGFKA